MTGPFPDLPDSAPKPDAAPGGGTAAAVQPARAANAEAFEAASPIERELARFEQASAALAAAARAARANSAAAAPLSVDVPQAVPAPASEPAAANTVQPPYRRRATDNVATADAAAATPPAAPRPRQPRPAPASPDFEPTLLAVDSAWASTSMLDAAAAEPPGAVAPPSATKAARGAHTQRWRLAGAAIGIAAVAGGVVFARWSALDTARDAALASTVQPRHPAQVDAALAAAQAALDAPLAFAPPAAGIAHPDSTPRPAPARDLAPPVAMDVTPPRPPAAAASIPLDAATRHAAWRARHARQAQEEQQSAIVESAIQDAQTRADHFLAEGATGVAKPAN